MTETSTDLSLNKYKPASADFEFQHYPFYWIMKVSSTYSQRMEKALKKGNINITSWRILMILKECGRLSVTDITNHAVSKTPTITRATYKIQEQGLVNISTSELDARVSMVEITEQGLATIDNVIKYSTKLFDGFYQDFTSAEIELLNGLLQKFYLNLE